MWTNEHATTQLSKMADAVRLRVRDGDADAATIAAGVIQTAMLVLVERDARLPPSLLLDVADALAERGRAAELPPPRDAGLVLTATF